MEDLGQDSRRVVLKNNLHGVGRKPLVSRDFPFFYDYKAAVANSRR
jgi:hypothetical protein